MKTLFALIALAALALLGSRFARSWLRRGGAPLHVVIASGAGYVILGLALGPLGAGLMSERILQALLPLVGFALAWVGVLMGTQLRIPQLRMFPRRLFFLLVPVVILPAAMVAAGLTLSGRLWPQLDLGWAGIALAVAASASLSLPTYGFALRRGAPEPLVQLLLAFAILANVLPVLLSLALSLTSLIDTGGLPVVQALSVALALGVGGGILLWLSMRLAAPRRDQFLLLMGVITLGGGLATMFHLSPLGIGFVAGAVYANIGGRGRSWSAQRLGRFERPIYLGLLLVAGARMPYQDWGLTATLLAVYLVLHVVVKIAAGWLLSREVVRGGGIGFDLRASLVPQGAIGLVVLVESLILYPQWISNTTVGVLVMSFLILEAAAPIALSGMAGKRVRAEG